MSRSSGQKQEKSGSTMQKNSLKLENLDSAVQKSALKLMMVVAGPLKRSSEISPEFPTPQMPDVTWKLKVYAPCVTPRREDIAVYLLSTGVKAKSLQEGHSMKIHSVLSICDEASKVVLSKFEGATTVDHVNAEYYLGYYKRNKAVRLEADISILGAGGDGGLSITSTAAPGEHQRPAKRKRLETEDEGGEGEQSGGVSELRQVWSAEHAKLIDDPDLADCVIEVKGEKIDAHKCILARHSKVLREMFCSKDEEGGGTVRMEEVSVPTVKAMLRYFYTGHVDEQVLAGDSGRELLEMADKYQLDALKNDLEGRLTAQVNIHTVLSFVRLALRLTVPKLKKACFQLITESRTDVASTKEWLEAKESDPRFVLDIMERAFIEK